MCCVWGGIVMGILSERFLLTLVVCGGNSDGNIE